MHVDTKRGVVLSLLSGLYCFFFDDTATAEIYTLSLHDALPIYQKRRGVGRKHSVGIERNHVARPPNHRGISDGDRKSTRLNSSHPSTSYAVFCLKKKTHRATRRPGVRQRRSTPLCTV